MNSLTQVAKRFKLAPEYAGWSVDDILMVMDDEECVFCGEYLKNGGNGSAAGRAVRAMNPALMQPTNKAANQRMASQKAAEMLKRAPVSTYLYLKLQEMRQKMQLDVSRSLEAYIRTYEDIREAAIGAEDFTPALKAHKELGILYGHTEKQDKSGSVNDMQLVLLIAGDDESLKTKLMKQLGHDDDVIEGELV